MASKTFSKLFTKSLLEQSNRVVSTSAANRQSIAITEVAPISVSNSSTLLRIDVFCDL